jgi:hypothetical protein
MPLARPAPLPPFNVGTLVPSTRDLFQALRTRRRDLAFVAHLVEEDAPREALRMAEAGVAALALSEPGPAMAEAAAAVHLPVLCLRPVATKDDYLAARAFGADAVLIDPTLERAAQEDLAKGARSTRMVAIDVAHDATAVEHEVAAGAKALVLKGVDAPGVRALASSAGPSLVLVAWPAAAGEDAVRALRGAVDAVIVGVEVYGVTGFERFVSEMSPG